MPFNRDKMRDLKMTDDAIYVLYDIVFENNLPPGVTQDEVTQHLTSCATEFTESRNLHKLAEVDVKNAINAVAREACHRRDKLITEEELAEAAEIVAAAAQIAAAVFAWAPGFNLGLQATALAAYAIATGLQVDADNYEDSVIDYIGNMNNEVVKQPGMEVVEKWQNAVAANGVFYPRLDIGIEHTHQRAIMLSIPTGIQQRGLGSVDADGYKAYIKQVGEFVFNNQAIVGQYEHLLASIDDSTTPDEFKQAKLSIDKTIPKGLSKDVDIFMDVVTFTLAAKNAKAYYKARSIVSEAADIPFDEVDENGDMVEGAGSEDAELSWLDSCEAIGEAISVLGGVAIIAMAGFQIKDTLKLESKLTESIGKGTTGLMTYYESLLKSAPNPDAPAATRVSP